MEPARIKLYGLLTMTRRRYRQQLMVALGLAAIVLALWQWLWPAFRQRLVPGEDAALDRFIAVMNVLPWIVITAVAIQLVEAFLVFRAFRRKEAQPPNPGA